MSDKSASFAFALGGVLTVQAVFAGYQILSKLVLSSGLNPISFALFRDLFASGVFLFAAVVFLPWSAWPKREHYGRFFVCGVSMFGGVFLNILALKITSPSVVTLLQPTQPMIAAALAAVFGYERLTLVKVIGIAFGCAGSVVAQFGSGTADGVDFGCVMVLFQCFFGANFMVQQWPLVTVGYSPLIVSAVSYFIATISTIVVGIVYFVSLSSKQRADVMWWDSSLGFLGVLIYVVLFATVYNYTVMSWATGKLGAPLVTLCMVFQVIFVCIAEWCFFDKPLTVEQTCGAILIFLGLCIVVAERQRETRDMGAVIQQENEEGSCQNVSDAGTT
eukprot:TRINITY_DN68480_c0_g1_i1.p1 TRINITY_DN68480_c0_g1~~TRINITY_DN68480_c0_g1_i1.p1  ORF type:complete len:333 (+),score=42.73 TRINITY_DN68480_c0_g1_i1:104-1102(+)